MPHFGQTIRCESSTLAGGVAGFAAPSLGAAGFEVGAPAVLGAGAALPSIGCRPRSLSPAGLLAGGGDGGFCVACFATLSSSGASPIMLSPPDDFAVAGGAAGPLDVAGFARGSSKGAKPILLSPPSDGTLAGAGPAGGRREPSEKDGGGHSQGELAPTASRLRAAAGPCPPRFRSPEP